MAGNRIRSSGAAAIGRALETSSRRARTVTEIDFSRNPMCLPDPKAPKDGESKPYDGLLEIARAIAVCPMILGVLLAKTSMDDDAGVKFLMQIVNQKTRRSNWGMATAKAEASTVASDKISDVATVVVAMAPAVDLPRQLGILDLSRNKLGVGFAETLPKFFAVCPLLHTLHLQYNQLGVQGGVLVAAALKGASALKYLDLSHNNLCGITPVFGSGEKREEWSGAAFTALSDAMLGGATINELLLHGNGACGLWPDRISGEQVLRGTYTSAAIDSLVHMLEQQQLPLKPPLPAAAGFRGFLGGLRLSDDNHMRKEEVRRLEKAKAENPTKPVNLDLSKTVASNKGGEQVKGVDLAEGEFVEGEPVEGQAISSAELITEPVLVIPDSKDEGAEEGEHANEKASSPGGKPVPLLANAEVEQTPEEKAVEEKKAGGKPGMKKLLDGKKKNPFAAKDKDKDATKGKNSTKEDDSGGDSSRTGGGDTERKDSARGGNGKTTPRGKPSGSATPRAGAAAAGAKKVVKKGSASPRSAPVDEKKEEKKAVKEVEPVGGKRKKGKKVEEEQKEDVNPFSTAPMMISMVPLVARKDENPASPTVGQKIGVGCLMRVLEEKTLDSTKRMFIALDGDTEALGWVTGLTKDGIENLKYASATYELKKASRTINCRDGPDNTSKKLDDIPKDALVRVLEEKVGADGKMWAWLAKGDSQVKEPIGWIQVSKEHKGVEVSMLDSITPLKLEFDLRVHTAKSLSRALGKKVEKVLTKKHTSALPFMVAGRRPLSRSDEGTPSRHRLIEKPATLLLMFNSHNAAFEVTKWTGSESFEKLPGEQQFDLVSKTSRKRIGVVRLAKELGMPFLERVEFADDWMLAEEHGLMHDGWQGSGAIELELTWGREVATVKVYPWLAYGCSIGARMLVRKGKEIFGCATVQRILADDRVVCRVDGYSKVDGVKGEQLVDIQPSTILPCAYAGYTRDTRLLLLHEQDKKQMLVDATVLRWFGALDASEGPRHMVNVKPIGATTGCQSCPSLNQFNHAVLVDPAMNADVYEELRMRYCKWLTTTEDKVEDAITGNQLLIAEQLIFMTAANILDGCNTPEYMSVHDVPQLVTNFLEPSPRRPHGSHIAQPVLCRAGPGTGKTWMVKQCLFLLADALAGENAGEGIRLVPVIVFVQRIVRLLREHGDDPTSLLQDPEGLLRWYIGNEFIDRKEEKSLLLLAYEMRACVILVDGVDEAAGLREVVEAFVHYELVTSGCRVVITSRPEGVDLDDYKARFVIMNLLELSQEQQRNVIQMQLQGNLFFEHLVNIGECRKYLDDKYRELFRSEALRNEVEKLGDEKEEKSAEGKEEEGAKDRKNTKEISEGAGGEAAKGDEKGKKGAAEADLADLDDEIEDSKAKTAKKGGKKGDKDDGKSKRPAGSVAILNPSAVKPVPRTPLSRRRMALDNMQDLQTWLDEAKTVQGRALRSNFLEQLNKALIKPCKVGTVHHPTLLDYLDSEIKPLPTPCTRAQTDEVIDQMQKDLKRTFPEDVYESLAQIGVLRKQPQVGGRRGAKAAPMPAFGLWSQATAKEGDKFALLERLLPAAMHLLGCVCNTVGMADYGLKREQEGLGDFIVGSATAMPAMKYRDPVEVWLEDTYPTTTEPAEKPPETYLGTITLPCSTGEQLVNLVKTLAKGVEVDFDGDEATLTKQEINNTFNPDTMHPTHLRNVRLQMLFRHKGVAVCFVIEAEHKDLRKYYVEMGYSAHYNFFMNRVNMPKGQFDTKFETLLVFLVEAIGVPVLLSLLLLCYSLGSGGSGAISLEELPQDRLQLYKLGILSGIKKRLAYTQQANEAVAEVTEKEEEQATDARPRREKRKGALDVSMGAGSSFSAAGGDAAGGQEATAVTKKTTVSNDPVLDLNSVLRGKKVRVVQGEDDVAECYSLVVRVLDKYAGGKGSDLRTSITAVVPKSHSMHLPVTALVEFVIAPNSQSETQLQETAKKMLRRVAVENQENGRREFTSKHVACALGATPEELGLWTRLDMDRDYGVALTATLAMQSDKAPAQYQFKHLSFQEGLYAEHLILLVTSLAPPQGPGWGGWSNDKAASEFLNNRYMNNTCRIAAGHLGSLLGMQRLNWDFHAHPLSPNGRSALWFITDDNNMVESITVSHNEITMDDVPGLSKMINTCKSLKALDLSDNGLDRLTAIPADWSRVCDSFATNVTLTDLNLNENKLGQVGVRIAARALRSCVALTKLGFAYNEPGVEPALAELVRVHPSLVSIDLREHLDRHLPSRAKDDIGRACLENKARKLGYLSCDTFVLSETTTSLTWPKDASTSDAVLLAGVMMTNTVLTTFNIGSGASLANSARSAIGEALLNNPGSRVAFCNDFGLEPKVTACEFDLSRAELKEVEPFRLLAGCLLGNRTLTHVTLKQLRSDQIPTLALALRGNSTLSRLDLIHISRTGGQAVVRLPVPELNGSKWTGTPTAEKPPEVTKATKAPATGSKGAAAEKVAAEKAEAEAIAEAAADGGRVVDLSQTCIEGQLGRVACEMIGTLIAANTMLECLNLSNTGLGNAIGAEGEGGHILLKPLCESAVCPLREINLTNIQLNDKAGAKLLSSFSSGLSKKTMGYEKITSLLLANNDLGKQTGAMLKEVLWGEKAPCPLKFLDLRGNVGLDGYDTALAIKRNESLTSVDIRDIPSANTDAIYSFLGSFLQMEQCNCRLGFLACDAFQVSAGQKELKLQSAKDRKASIEAAAAAAAAAARGSSVKIKEPDHVADSVGVSNPVLMLLAGVLRFNTSLEDVIVTETGLDNAAAAFFQLALQDNKTLKQLDISNNPIGAEGVALIAGAARMHPCLESIKIDGARLPVPVLRGATGTDTALNVADWGLGPLSGHAIGAIARENRTMQELNVKNNQLGASGIAAIVSGLGEAPLRLLDVARNGLGGDAKAMEELAMSICSNLNAIVDLRMDEDDIDCPPDALAPLCKLRNVRSLALDRNRLTGIPSLIGTMTSLRKISLHSNQIIELPASMFLLTALEALDLHKNSIKVLPATIGNLRALNKLDLSENRLQELPVTICELNEALQLSVGRNPLEKPSIEQARQGVGAIRRFFGFGKGRDLEAVLDPDREFAGRVIEDEESVTQRIRPEGREENAPSRHDWAPPGGMILLFNCSGVPFTVVDGGSDPSSLPDGGDVELVSAFNLQVVGNLRPSQKHGEPWLERVLLHNRWFPWRTAEPPLPGTAAPIVTIHMRWQPTGQAKQVLTILVSPWLAYACGVGARMKTGNNFVTVVKIRPDDTVAVKVDNETKEGVELSVDPRPDTVSRTASASYKSGQKLLLMHENAMLDAVVEEWMGVRRGSRHRVRLGNRGSTGKRVIKEVDLNEVNHTKLLFPTASRYEDARNAYLDKLVLQRATMRDEALGRDLPVREQRIFLDTIHVPGVGEPIAGPAGALPAPPPAPPPKDNRTSKERPGTPPPVALPPAAKKAQPDTQKPKVMSAHKLVDDTIDQSGGPTHLPAPAFVLSGGKAEHELLLQQMTYIVAAKLRDGSPDLGPVRLVPLVLSLTKLKELLMDEATAKKPPREIIIKCFELDYLASSDMLKQAIEMRALMGIVDVEKESDLHVLVANPLIFEELLSLRLIVVCAGEEQSILSLCPKEFKAQAAFCKLAALGLYLNEVEMSEKSCKELLKRMRASGGTLYSLVTSLHLASADFGREGALALQELLMSQTCTITSLDLSCTKIDGFPLIQAFKGNTSVTSLDVRQIPGFANLYQSLGDSLLQEGAMCRLGYMRCDAFEVLEGEKVLSLKETPLEPGSVRLLLGLLKHNKTVTEVDLTATDLETAEAHWLAKVVDTSKTLSALRLQYNPALDEECKAAIRTAAASKPQLRLEL